MWLLVDVMYTDCSDSPVAFSACLFVCVCVCVCVWFKLHGHKSDIQDVG